MVPRHISNGPSFMFLSPSFSYNIAITPFLPSSVLRIYQKLLLASHLRPNTLSMIITPIISQEKWLWTSD